MKNKLFKFAVSLVAVTMIAPFNVFYAAAEDAQFTINCPNEAIVGNDISTSIVCNSSEEFSSLYLTLKYDPTYLQPKMNQDNELVWNVNTDAGDPADDSAKISESGDGVLYIMMPDPDNVTYHYLNLNLTFVAINEGSAQFELTVNELYKDADTEVPHDNQPIIAGIDLKAQNTETTTTAETTATETTTITTETTTATSIESSHSTETTTSEHSNPSGETTTTTATTTSIESETQPQSTTQSTSNSSTSNPESSSQSTTSTNSTTKTTTTTKSTTTTKTSTTTSNNKNSNGSVDTGDNFPLALVLASISVAGVALVKTSPRKKDEE